MLKINKAQITGPTGRGVDLKRKKKVKTSDTVTVLSV